MSSGLAPKVNQLIEELRSLIRATPNQREEMVLYSIERSGATTETEIAEDTRLHRCVVNELVAALINRGILYRVSRTVIGSDRPQFAIKSNRAKSSGGLLSNGSSCFTEPNAIDGSRIVSQKLSSAQNAGFVGLSPGYQVSA
jgi:hypothetical protein